jgi:Prolyl oligopeptidase family
MGWCRCPFERPLAGPQGGARLRLMQKECCHMCRNPVDHLIAALVFLGAGQAYAEPVRGSLLPETVTRVLSLDPEQLKARTEGPEENADAMFQGIMRMPSGTRLHDLTGTDIRCGVDVWYMQFHTVGGAGKPTTASGAVMVPTGDEDCTGPRPIVLYARSASMQKNINIADLDQNYLGEPEMLASLFASQGYIVIATNYAGYEKSTLPYHPYMNADQQSKEMIDALAAGKAMMAENGGEATAGDTLFLSGYSQGGFVAMATHRAMQDLGIEESTPGDGFQVPLLITSFQNSYGDIYAAAEDFYNPAFASGIEGLLPADGNPGRYFSEGRLPQKAIFSDVAPKAADPTLQRALDAVTPPITGTATDARARSVFGEPSLVRNDIRRDFLLDVLSYPDGATLSADGIGLPNPVSENPLRRAFQLNDLRGWSPERPVYMCSLQSNPWVSFQTNQHLMAQLWAGLPAGRVTSLDLEEAPSDADSAFVRNLKAEMRRSSEAIVAGAISQGATDGGTTALGVAYHHWLGEPLCMAATLVYFEGILAEGR